MTYSTGNLVVHDDYNIFATGSASGAENLSVANINSLWGVGQGDKGYGQTSPPIVTPVSIGQIITSGQWSVLLARMRSIASHEGVSIPAIVDPFGVQITPLSSLNSNISVINSNRLSCFSNGSDQVDNTLTNGGSPWFSTATHTINAVFSTYDNMRYYFNTGGKLRFSFSMSGSGGTPAGTRDIWINLLNASGTIELAATSTSRLGGWGSASILASSTGFHQIGAGTVVLFRKYDPLSYIPDTGDYVELTATGNSGTPNIITFVARYVNTASFIANTITTTHTARPPETTYIANSWGGYTFSAGSNSQG